MEVVIVETPADAAPIVADAYTRLLNVKPDAILGLATGSTPLGVYHELIRRHKEEGLSFAQVHSFNLDEYVGLPEGHPEAYSTFIRREFTDQVDIPAQAVRGPDGLAEDLLQAAIDYDNAIVNSGGIDLQILGIGSDGHIAFNEPMSSLGSRTRLKTLTEQTREDNARFFDGDIEAVPRMCLTQGIGTIMEARHVIMLGFGENKADAVHACVEGPVMAKWPASALQFHPRCTVVVDEAAASKLDEHDYYKTTFSKKPEWQPI
ncbi:MAG: glucosamine-6-phosphate deaminase [Candidatus Nanopelagicales bacterium]